VLDTGETEVLPYPHVAICSLLRSWHIGDYHPLAWAETAVKALAFVVAYVAFVHALDRGLHSPSRVRIAELALLGARLTLIGRREGPLSSMALAPDGKTAALASPERLWLVEAVIQDSPGEAWYLLTDWPVTSPETARRIFIFYRQRWAVEDTFKFVKTCLGLEQVQMLSFVAVRTLVPMAGLMAVNGLMSQAQQGSLIVAPSVAGELVLLVGANSCFLYDSFSFFFSAVLVMTLTIDRQALPGESSAVFDSMRQGFGFIFKHSTISFVILSMTAGMFAMRCFGALLSIYLYPRLAPAAIWRRTPTARLAVTSRKTGSPRK